MENNKEVAIFTNNAKIFVMEDPILKVNIEKECDGNIKLKLEYPFTTPVLFAFIFELKNGYLPGQEGWYINDECKSRVTNYSESAIKMFIDDKQMIYNGSYYKLIN